MEEEWRAIAGFADYEASNLGRVRSWSPRTWNARRPSAPRLLRPVQMVSGYLAVFLCASGIRVQCTVHVIVLESFMGPRPTGMICRHLDGNRRNNRLPNLAWGTQTENLLDAHNHGTICRGERRSAVARRVAGSAAPPLKEGDIVAIRESSLSQSVLALKYGVARSSISQIKCGRTWKHV